MSTTPFTDSYRAELKARGGVYISALPANTNLGPDVLGAPGGRNPDPSARLGWSYELAPLTVRAEQGFELGKESAVAAVAGGLTQVGDAVSLTLGDAFGAMGLSMPLVGAVILLAIYLSIRKVL